MLPCGWGRDRTVDLTIFSRTLVPTELPSLLFRHLVYTDKTMVKALITGVSGQDGRLLSRYLQSQGDVVIGLVGSHKINENISHLDSVIQIDHQDSDAIRSIFDNDSFDVVYNLVGFSSVSDSFMKPITCFEINSRFVFEITKAIRLSSRNKDLSFFQASSSEMYGGFKGAIVDEKSEMRPISPYGHSKYISHRFLGDLRETQDMRISCGILFNHESPLRPIRFFSRKVVSGLVDILEGKKRCIELHNLEIERDWGYAGDYVKAMRLIAMSSINDDFIISSGESRSVRDFITSAISYLNLSGDFDYLVRTSNKADRPIDHKGFAGNNSKIRNVLGWTPETDFASLVKILIDGEIEFRKASI